MIIAAWSEIPAESTLRTLLTGTASLLTSQFRLTYAMILSLLRVSDLSVEDMIKRSFSEFHTQRALQQQNLATQLRQLEMRLEKISNDGISASTLEIFATYRKLRSAAGGLLRTIVSRGWTQHMHGLYAKGRVLWLHTPYTSRPLPAVVLPAAATQSKPQAPAISAAGSSELAQATARLKEEHMKAAMGSSNLHPIVETSLRVIVLMPDKDSTDEGGWTEDAVPSDDCEGVVCGRRFKVVSMPFSAVLCATEQSVDIDDGKLSSALGMLVEMAHLPPSIVDTAKALQLPDFEVQNYSKVICTLGASVLGLAFDSIDSSEFSALWEEEELKTKVQCIL